MGAGIARKLGYFCGTSTVGSNYTQVTQRVFVMKRIYKGPKRLVLVNTFGLKKKQETARRSAVYLKADTMQANRVGFISVRLLDLLASSTKTTHRSRPL